MPLYEDDEESLLIFIQTNNPPESDTHLAPA